MERTCIDPTAIREGDLVAYVDGEAEEAVVRHFHQCPACAREAEVLRQLEARLRAKLCLGAGSSAKGE
jgi:anti-sigma factor RsiW